MKEFLEEYGAVVFALVLLMGLVDCFASAFRRTLGGVA